MKLQTKIFLGWLIVWAAIAIVASILVGCGGGGDEAPTVAEEAPKYHVPATPDPCTTTYPCQPK